MFEGLSKVEIVGYLTGLLTLMDWMGANGDNLVAEPFGAEYDLGLAHLQKLLEKEHTNESA